MLTCIEEADVAGQLEVTSYLVHELRSCGLLQSAALVLVRPALYKEHNLYYTSDCKEVEPKGQDTNGKLKGQIWIYPMSNPAAAVWRGVQPRVTIKTSYSTFSIHYR